MNESTNSQPHADGHHHNGSEIVAANESQKTSGAANGNREGTIGDLATMAAGLATKVEELARLAKDLSQQASAKTRDPAHAADGGGQKAKQGALSNNDLKTSPEQKSPSNNR